jgi:hypothetical protein
MKPCDNCTNKGKLLGLTKATYCENCIHGATFLRDLYMPMTTIDQMKARILAQATVQPLSDFDELVEFAKQSRRLSARLTTNWFLYGKRGVTIKFNRYNPFEEHSA